MQPQLTFRLFITPLTTSTELPCYLPLVTYVTVCLSTAAVPQSRRTQGSGYWFYPPGTCPLLLETFSVPTVQVGYNNRPRGAWCCSIPLSNTHLFPIVLFFPPLPSVEALLPIVVVRRRKLPVDLLQLFDLVSKHSGTPPFVAIGTSESFLWPGSATSLFSTETTSIPTHSPLRQTHIHSFIRPFSP